MSLRFVDSFDHYATGDLTEKWNSSTGSPTVTSSVGRRSTSACRFNGNESLTKTIDAQGTWIVGFAYSPGSGSVATIPILRILDAGTLQVDVRLNTDGTLTVTRNGTTLSTTSFALSAGTYYHIEFKVVIHDTTGSYDLRVNGSSKTSGTNVDTKNTANATANQISIGTPSASTVGNHDYDDLHICDGQGSTNNDFLGDCRVDAYLPSGNGNSSQLTGSDGNSTDNNLLVDESAPNDDTDYVESATVGNKDTYAFADMTHTRAASSVLRFWQARRRTTPGLNLSRPSPAPGARTLMARRRRYQRAICIIRTSGRRIRIPARRGPRPTSTRPSMARRSRLK